MSDTDKSFNNVQVGDLREALDQVARDVQSVNRSLRAQGITPDDATGIVIDAARKTLAPITDEEVERSAHAMYAGTPDLSATRRALEAFMGGRFGQ